MNPDLSIKKADSCRICGNKNLEDVFSIGDQYVNNFLSFNNSAPPSPVVIVFVA